jgi:alkylation response protein AidB-like acyl-CoA dehydrogenase
MEFNYTPEQEQFRARLRGWLESTSQEVFGDRRGAFGASLEGLIFGRDDAAWQRALEYHRRLHRAGYLALHWPREWGGAGAGLVEQAIYQDEVLRLGLPTYGVNQLAIDRMGPTIMLFGSREQKKRFLPAMLSAEEIWCQGYSEPNAGSDLASLQTRASVEGDHFIVNGQKVWTSLAHRADWQVLLVRTEPSVPKHQGISCLLVDMKSQGITIRPLVQMTGETKFNEVYYDNVRVPKTNLLGALNEGWRVSIAMLTFQRLSAGTRHPLERMTQELIELAARVDFDGTPAHRHPYVRQQLARFAAETQCLKLLRYRVLTSQLKGKAAGPETSLGKLFASELQARIAAFACQLLGPWAAVEGGENPRHVWVERMLGAREYTIAGGTSEIQRNIIGERVLRLPKG